MNRKYLTDRNNQEHCYYWTNQIIYFNKRVTLAIKRGYANIK